MPFELIPAASGLLQKQAINEVIKCNGFTEQYGLRLTETQAKELVETRSFALNQTGRIEFGGGVIDKVIKAFCDSPYISMHNYAETIHELVEIFYYYKNETLDMISDDDLIKFMKDSFDNICQGSLELLSGRELYKLARKLRFGSAYNDYEDSVAEGSEDDYE